MTITVWTVPLAAWSGVALGLGWGMAWRVMRAHGKSNLFQLLLLVGTLGGLVSIGNIYYGHLSDKEVRASVATDVVKQSDQRWIAYTAYLNGKGALPAKRPMTRTELVAYWHRNFPQALMHHARMGMQSQRSIIMQYLNPVFSFKSDLERMRYAVKHLAALGVYKDAYPEFVGR